MKKIIIGLMLILNGLCMADFQLKDMSEFRYDNAYIGLILVTEDDRLLMEVKINQQGGESVSSLIDIDRNAIKTIKRTYVNNEHIYPKMLKYLEFANENYYEMLYQKINLLFVNSDNDDITWF